MAKTTSELSPIVYSFRTKFDFSVPESLKRGAMRALNVYHAGKEEIPFGEPIGGDHIKASWLMNMVHRIKVEGVVRADGSVEFKMGDLNGGKDERG